MRRDVTPTVLLTLVKGWEFLDHIIFCTTHLPVYISCIMYNIFISYGFSK